MRSPRERYSGVDAVRVQSGKILVVDDEVAIQDLLTEALAEEGYEVATAEDGKQAIQILERQRFDLVVTDMIMPVLNGIEVLLAAKRIDPQYPVIMITGYPSVETAVRLVQLGAADYITKPFNLDVIKITIAKVLEMQRLGTRAPGGFDGLTQLYDFDMFRRLLENELRRSEWRGYVCTLLMVKVHGFEVSASDRSPWEHDRILTTFATILERVTRPWDIIARTDQAEFAAILPETDRGDGHDTAAKVRREAEWKISLKVGVVSYPEDALDAEGLIKAARAAVEAAKARGGGKLPVPQTG